MADFIQESDTETAIFQAALTVFARKGKDGARMQEIADEAGINKALLHYYYRSKDGLYRSVFRAVMQHFLESVEEAIAQEGPFREVLKNVIAGYIDEHRKHPEVARMWMQENLNGAPIAREFLLGQIDRGRTTTAERVMQRIQRAIDDGEIREVDPLHLLLSVLGASVFFFLSIPVFSAIHPGLADDPNAEAERRKQHVFDLIYHGLEPN